MALGQFPHGHTLQLGSPHGHMPRQRYPHGHMPRQRYPRGHTLQLGSPGELFGCFTMISLAN